MWLIDVCVVVVMHNMEQLFHVTKIQKEDLSTNWQRFPSLSALDS